MLNGPAHATVDLAAQMAVTLRASLIAQADLAPEYILPEAQHAVAQPTLLPYDEARRRRCAGSGKHHGRWHRGSQAQHHQHITSTSQRSESSTQQASSAESRIDQFLFFLKDLLKADRSTKKKLVASARSSAIRATL